MAVRLSKREILSSVLNYSGDWRHGAYIWIALTWHIRACAIELVPKRIDHVAPLQALSTYLVVSRNKNRQHIKIYSANNLRCNYLPKFTFTGIITKASMLFNQTSTVQKIIQFMFQSTTKIFTQIFHDIPTPVTPSTYFLKQDSFNPWITKQSLS